MGKNLLIAQLAFELYECKNRIEQIQAITAYTNKIEDLETAIIDINNICNWNCFRGCVMKIQIKILNKKFYSNYQSVMCPEGYIAKLPEYGTPGSAAVDLLCTEDAVLHPGETRLIPTGLAIHIGSGGNPCRNEQSFSVAGLIVPRSGLGTKGLILANTIGIIDEDYQGELKIAAWNRNTFFDNSDIEDFVADSPIHLRAGDRIAQLMFIPFIKTQWEIVDEFSETTQRGVGGFGSTGV